MLALLAQAEGRTGYDVSVTVSNTTSSTSWGWSHSTDALSFSSESQVKGDGNSSRYVKVGGFAGIGLKERSHTKEGRIKEDKRLAIESYVTSISISESVTNNAEKYSVSISESMPASLLNVEEIMYRGEGIYKWNSYINNKDKVMTNYNAKKFSESSVFLGRYLNASIYAEVTPAIVNQFIGENYSTIFQVASESDLRSQLRFESDNEYLEEDYIGSFKMTKKMSTKHEYQLVDDEAFSDYLECCPAGYGYLNYPLQTASMCLCRSALVKLNGA